MQPTAATPTTPDPNPADELAPWPVGGSLRTRAEHLAMIAPEDYAEEEAERHHAAWGDDEDEPAEIVTEQHRATPLDLAEIEAELDRYFGAVGDEAPAEIDSDEHSDTLPEPGR